MPKKHWVTFSIVTLMSMSWTVSAFADTLSSKKDQLAQKQKESQQLQSQLNQTKQQIEEQKQKTNKLQSDLQQTQAELSQTTNKINSVNQEQQKLQKQINQLNAQIKQTQDKLSDEKQNMEDMLRFTYENGNVSYLAVLFQSTSFSDFLSRFYALSLVMKQQNKIIEGFKKTNDELQKQEQKQDESINQLKQQQLKLVKLKEQQSGLQNETQKSIQTVAGNVSLLQKQEDDFSRQMHLTQKQVQELKQQIAEQEAIMATQSGNIVEANLQYHPVSAQKLYEYVQKYDKTNIGYPSDFSVSDMEIICEAGKNYNVNPILLVAITGAEESFVPTKFPAHSYWASEVEYIHNNPFNVYYSWMWTKENRPSWTLTTTANIAANTVKHKLSTTPRYGDTAFQWLNDARNPWGLYATDPAWSSHVEYFFRAISNYVYSN